MRSFMPLQQQPSIGPVHKQVLINRIEQIPTQEELDRAHRQVYGGDKSEQSEG